MWARLKELNNNFAKIKEQKKPDKKKRAKRNTSETLENK